MPLNQMSGLPMDLAVYGSGTGPQPFATARGLRPLPRRACASSRAGPTAPSRMMRAGMSRGITLPRPAMAKVVPQLREIVTAEARGQHLLGARSRRCRRTSPPTDRQRITRRICGRARAAKCCRRTRGSRISSSATIYPRRAPRWAGPICPMARPGIAGASAARPPWTCRRRRSTSSASREVARIRGEMLAVKEQVGFKGDLDAFFKYLEEDPQFYFDSEDELLDAYRDVKRRIDALLPKLFADFPKADYEIRAGRAVPRRVGGGRLLPGAFGRRQTAGHLLHQHPQPEGAAAFRARDAVAARSRARASLPDLDPAGAHRAAALPPLQRLRVVLGRLGAVRGIDRQGARASSPIRTSGTAGSRTKCCAPCAWWSTPGCMRRAGRASRRSSTCSTTRRWPRATSPPKSSATSSGPARRWATSWASCTSARCAPRRRPQLGATFDVREFHSQVLRDGARADGRVDREDRSLDRVEAQTARRQIEWCQVGSGIRAAARASCD